MPRNNSQQSKDLAAAAFTEQNNKIKNLPKQRQADLQNKFSRRVSFCGSK
jgi:hypothetical protein